ncbi:hypothetical protein [Bradyrhizobium nanningense]|nr:hypothetical protein [Bradyrhizobium nanningense]
MAKEIHHHAVAIQIEGYANMLTSSPRLKAFLARPIEGDWPYPRTDPTHVKVRQNGRIMSVAVMRRIRKTPAR